MLLLLEVEECGSIGRAAERAGYTTSALSQQLAKLETEAGLRLLHRSSSGTQLTEAGAALAVHARRIATELRLAEQDLEDRRLLRAGRVRLGAFPSAAAYLLPSVFKTYRALYPEVDISVNRWSPAVSLTEMLLAREIDLSPMWEYTWSALPTDKFDVVQLLEDPTVLLVPSGHRVTGQRIGDLALLSGESWVSRGDHPLTDVLVRSARAAGFEPHIVYEAGDYHEAEVMVASGIGLALAPRMTTTRARDDVTIVELGAMVPSRKVVLAHLKGETLQPAAKAMEEVFVAVAHRMAELT